MSYPTFALLLVCAVGASFALIIDSPRWGDTISSKSFTITWHDIANVEDPIALTLMQGESSSTLHGVMTINSLPKNHSASSPLNNGTYTWGPYPNTEFEDSGFSALASGCNYSIRITSRSETAFSEYFSFLSVNGGPLEDSIVCPAEKGMLRPSNGTTLALPSSSTSTNQANSSNTSSDTATSNQDSPSSGISIATLGIAIAIPIVVLLVVFGIFFYLARKKGWLIFPQYRQTMVVGQDKSLMYERGPIHYEQGTPGTEYELDGRSRLVQLP